MDAGSIIQLTIQIIYALTVVGLTTVIISENRNPQKTISWVLVLIFLPVIGIILYLAFGQNFRRHWSVSRRMTKDLEGKTLPYFNIEEHDDREDCYRKLKHLLKNIGYAPVLDGNRIEYLSTGEDKFTRLFADIEQATDHIHLLYYKVIDGEVGNRLKELLIRKAKENVEVRLIYDDVGSLKANPRFFKELKAGGVQVNCFLPIRFPYIARRVNYRNHRKIAVIDGRVGYIGGFNISDEYVKGLSWGIWHDLSVRVEGKGVYGLQLAFLLDWFYSQKETLDSPKFFPEQSPVGDSLMQVVSCSPIDTFENITEGFFQAINSARQSIYIQTPYFIPSTRIIKAMQTAALSGVEVHLMIPARSDNLFVGSATFSYIRNLLNHQIKVYLYTAGFLHSKMMVIDESLTIVGSANMDVRSFELNFETSAFIYDEETAKKGKAIFMKDVEDADLVAAEKWNARSRFKLYFESLMRLLTPLF